MQSTCYSMQRSLPIVRHTFLPHFTSLKSRYIWQSQLIVLAHWHYLSTCIELANVSVAWENNPKRQRTTWRKSALPYTCRHRSCNCVEKYVYWQLWIKVAGSWIFSKYLTLYLHVLFIMHEAYDTKISV